MGLGVINKFMTIELTVWVSLAKNCVWLRIHPKLWGMSVLKRSEERRDASEKTEEQWQET